MSFYFVLLVLRSDFRKKYDKYVNPTYSRDEKKTLLEWSLYGLKCSEKWIDMVAGINKFQVVGQFSGGRGVWGLKKFIQGPYQSMFQSILNHMHFTLRVIFSTGG